MNTENALEVDQVSRHPAHSDGECELCCAPGGEILWEDEFCRVIHVIEKGYPGFCRVVLQQHAREMTDLNGIERQRLMSVVFAVETALRKLYQPDKINLASFGNVVPHVHWHIIPRWHDDRHFPEPIWGTAQRVTGAERPVLASHALRAGIGREISREVTGGGS